MKLEVLVQLLKVTCITSKRVESNKLNWVIH